MGERVNKIRFIGSINKATRVRKSVTLQTLETEREKTHAHVKEKRRVRPAISASNQVRVGLIIL